MLQRYVMQLFLFTRELFKRFDGAVSITAVLKESEYKIEGSSPSKTFFYIYIFCFRKDAGNFFVIYMFAEKHVLTQYVHVKPLHSVKWRSLYGDTAAMQELLLKTCTRLKGGKEYVLKNVIIWKQRMHRRTETRACKFSGPD